MPRSGREGRDASSIALRLHNLDNIPVVTASFRGGQDFFVFTCACNVCSQTVWISWGACVSQLLSAFCVEMVSLSLQVALASPFGQPSLPACPAVPFRALQMSGHTGLTFLWVLGLSAPAFILSWEALHPLSHFFTSEFILVHILNFFFLFSHRSSFGCMFIGFCNNVS